MKIIHTADIHLDSPFSGVADAKTRRGELLSALNNLSEYANNNGVSAIIVAGDLFDDKFATEMTVKSVAQIVSQSKAQWFVLQGNHGDATPYNTLKALCPQVNLFGDGWVSYGLGGVEIVGRELGHNDREAWQSFACSKNDFSILVLHGDVDSDAYGFVDKAAIAASNVNYVALGHRHAYKETKFGRVPACYSGVLEARGFDETAPTGFVVVDTDRNTHTFVPQAIRRVETKTIDVSGVETELALQRKLLDELAEVSPRCMLNVEIVGAVPSAVRVADVARALLDNRYFALRICNKTTVALDLSQLSQEVSLRGEFVRLAMQIADEAERNEVLALGLKALGGDLS